MKILYYILSLIFLIFANCCLANKSSRSYILNESDNDTSVNDWSFFGQGDWTDPYWTDAQGNPLNINVEVEVSTQNDKLYRVKVFDEENGYVVVHTEDPEKIYVEPYKHKNSDDIIIVVDQICRENKWGSSYYGHISDNKIFIPADYFNIYPFNDESSRFKGSSERGLIFTLPKEDMKSGIYLGLASFNSQLETFPISWVGEATEHDFISFIDQMTMQNGTLLYFSVDKSIASLESCKFPNDVENVMLITFTDGLDNGSLMYNDSFSSNKEYASYISQKISNLKIKDCPLQSYMLGFPSVDIWDYNNFESVLNELASGRNYVVVGNMSDINNKLQEIAEKISEPVVTWDLSFKMPMVANGTVVRCTLDDKTPDESDIWVELTFNNFTSKIEDIVYHGMTSSSGNSLGYSMEPPFMKFSLSDCRVFSPDLGRPNISVNMYNLTSGKWQLNNEFSFYDTMESKAKGSSAVILNLDCSSSLGSLFPELKVMAKSFVTKLCEKNIETKIGTITVNETFEKGTKETEYYNLQGVRVINPTAGIYICRKAGVAKKAIIR